MDITPNEILALSPEGSINHTLSEMEVRQQFASKGSVIRLVREPIVVVLVGYARGGGYEAKVIASQHPAYPVGGYDLYISDDEVARSILIDQQAILYFADEQAVKQP